MKEGKNKGLSGLGVFYTVLAAVGGIALFAGMVKIQWVDGEMWRQKARAREKEYRTEPARRGNIYSSDGKILATTVPVCDLYLDLGKWLKKDKDGKFVTDSVGHTIVESLIADSNYTKYIGEVCRILHEAEPSKSESWFYERINNERLQEKPHRCYLIQRGIPYSYWMQICKLPGWNKLVVKKVDGESVVREIRRHTYGNLAENTIGFRNGLKKTYTGLEGKYDSILRGQDGLLLCRRLTKGVWLPIHEGNNDTIALDEMDSTVVRSVIDGKHIVSTIDTRYQDIAESSLRKSLRTYGGRSGCAVLMEIETGYVLACCNLTYDTGAHDYLELPDRNIAVSDIAEPGSTFKAIILSAMLEASNHRLDTAMKFAVPQCGSKTFPGKYGEIRDDHTLPGRDSLSVSEIIAQSSNIGMCQIGWTFFNDRRDSLKHTAERMFPLGRLNVDLRAPESRSYFNDVNASNRDFLNFCYGYSASVSALQTLTFYNALGAGGRMVKPLFCKAILDGDKVLPIEPVVLNERICSPQTAAILKDLLVGVVERGTGNNIKNNTYGIAGKTGTAIIQKGTSRYNGSFAGFFPADNPKYSCIVVIKDSPAYGRQAAPVFKAVADCVMAIDKGLGNIETRRGTGKLVNGKWIPDTTATTPKENHPHIAKGRQSAILLASNRLGLPFISTDSNSCWGVYVPGVDSLRTRSHYAQYKVSSGTVPDCTGMTAKDAVALLNEMGYKVRIKGIGKVSRQEPRAKTSCKQGSVVNVYLN